MINPNPSGEMLTKWHSSSGSHKGSRSAHESQNSSRNSVSPLLPTNGHLAYASSVVKGKKKVDEPHGIARPVIRRADWFPKADQGRVVGEGTNVEGKRTFGPPGIEADNSAVLPNGSLPARWSKVPHRPHDDFLNLVVLSVVRKICLFSYHHTQHTFQVRSNSSALT
jgi:hypothetical protein